MTKSIRTILMPFLMLSYVVGSTIANSSRYSKWFSVLYMLLIWSVYYFFATSTLITSFTMFDSAENNICTSLEFFVTLLSIVFGVYHDRKFQNCLRKFDIVDNTLLKLGTITNYDKLCKKTVWFTLGWFVSVIFLIFSAALFINNEHNRDLAACLFCCLIQDYCCHINFIGDLITASILEYIGLKFDQVNEHLHNMIRNNEHKIQAWQNSIIHPHQHRFSKLTLRTLTKHLHLELRKISCEIDSIFGTQMTFKMACYFAWIAIDLRDIFHAILINNYVKYKIIFFILHFVWFIHNCFKFLLINYMCETVSTKARATADLLNKLLCFSCDIEIREIILQFSSQTIYTPLRFCGNGFFQFGFKFLYRFVISVATVLIIVIQSHVNK